MTKIATEDDVFLREELMDILQKAGYEVVGVTDFQISLTKLSLWHQT